MKDLVKIISPGLANLCVHFSSSAFNSSDEDLPSLLFLLALGGEETAFFLLTGVATSAVLVDSTLPRNLTSPGLTKEGLAVVLNVQYAY